MSISDQLQWQIVMENLVEILVGGKCEFGRLVVGKPLERQLHLFR